MSTERPKLDKSLDGTTFRSYYYLKEELVQFCRENKIPSSGGKIELTNRIAEYLDTGIITKNKLNSNPRGSIDGIDISASQRNKEESITINTVIEPNIVCSEIHRAFFKEKIGKRFSFNVAFQKWLKSNAGKTYADAIEAYYVILEEKKKGKTKIDKQFEYNTYIRDFFADNKGKSLEDAICCWKYKKSKQGHNRYERDDVKALQGKK